jgi:hypothetical protein
MFIYIYIYLYTYTYTYTYANIFNRREIQFSLFHMGHILFNEYINIYVCSSIYYIHIHIYIHMQIYLTGGKYNFHYFTWVTSFFTAIAIEVLSDYYTGIYIYICMYVCMYIYICIFIYVYICTNALFISPYEKLISLHPRCNLFN